MKVVEQEQQRLLGRKAPQQLRPGLEKRRAVVGAGRRTGPTQRRQQLGHARGWLAELAPGGRDADLVDVAAQRLDERLVGREALALVGAALEHAPPGRGRLRAELGQQPRLAHAGLAVDQGQLGLADARALEQRPQEPALAAASGQARSPNRQQPARAERASVGRRAGGVRWHLGATILPR